MNRTIVAEYALPLTPCLVEEAVIQLPRVQRDAGILKAAVTAITS